MTSPAISTLIKGYQQFRKAHFEDAKTYEPLINQGQEPKVLVIACADSRVDPAIITGAGPGELFMVRNVANLVPPFEGDSRHHGTSAALEFGVLGLGVTDIIVFGHSQCGGINALMTANGSDDQTDFIHTWMKIATPAKEAVMNEHPGADMSQLCHACEKQSALISIENLMTFPWIKSRVEQGELNLHAWYFNMSEGRVEAFNEDSNAFAPLVE